MAINWKNNKSNSGEDLKIVTPSFPKGGGAISGLGEMMETQESDGMLRFSIPIPVSSGRGYAPSLKLSYHSGAGNGIFGMGWQVNALSIYRLTGKGILSYSSDDRFCGPDGNELIPEIDSDKNIVTRDVSRVQNIELDVKYRATRFFPRAESNYDRIEFLEPLDDESVSSCWLIHSSDGQIHWYGKTVQARIACPDNSSMIASWLLEESVSPTGEHICYVYEQENGVGELDDNANHHYGANRYLSKILYGNKNCDESSYLINRSVPDETEWLFAVIFDYGARGLDPTKPPAYEEKTNWIARQDCFSTYAYGFEIRTCRLCRQILAYHNFDELGKKPYLVSRYLLEYEENPSVSMLSGVQRMAYGDDGAYDSLPPLDLNYYTMDVAAADKWTPFPILPEIDNGAAYQLVDLYGEGIPGVLCHYNSAWYYSAPIRNAGGGSVDSIQYQKWTRLESIPSLQPGMLLDFNGDGYMEWLVTQPAIAGLYSFTATGEWAPFIPLRALPVELYNARSILSDIIGTGAADLILIGPKSIRLYPNNKSGFDSIGQILRSEADQLPSAVDDGKEVVMFSDILGSGQQHLVRIRHDEVMCWPNMGNGHFGEAIAILNFFIEESTFNPSRVYAADIDGSGTTDIVYAMHDRIRVFMNQSGNAFANPFDVMFPDGVFYDDLCRLTFSDIRGLGISDIVLTVPYVSPRNWFLAITNQKPYLLHSCNNNMGVNTEFEFRSSAQFWLDEKSKNLKATSRLPFPIQTLARVVTMDEISENQVEKKYIYLHGVYDRAQNDFAGFGKIILSESAKDSAGNISEQIPMMSKQSWYHTGRKGDEERIWSEQWSGDTAQAFTRSTRFTVYNKNTESDEAYTPDNGEKIWLYRVLSGAAMREEVYTGNIDGTSVPYSTQSYRYQVRKLQNEYQERGCVSIALPLESSTYTYEQITCDPQHSQTIWQVYDVYGYPTQIVDVLYPRRPKGKDNPYGNRLLPETTWDSSYDTQQTVLRLSRVRRSVYHLTDNDRLRLGIPWQERTDFFAYSSGQVPESDGIFMELLTNQGTLKEDPSESKFGGQTEICYQNRQPPDTKALPYCIRGSVYDETDLTAYEGILSDTDLKDKLTASGYVQAPELLGDSDEGNVWAAEQNLIDYAGREGFFRPIKKQSSLLTGPDIMSWDSNCCAIISVQNALESRVSFQIDYRFLVPVEIIDANANVSRIKLDLLGRTLYGWRWGSEQGKRIGFALEPIFTPPRNISEGFDLTPPLPIEYCFIYQPSSWMGRVALEKLRGISQAEITLLIKSRMLTFDGYIRSNGRNSTVPNIILEALIAETERAPVHSLEMRADRWPDDAMQQIQARVMFSNGLGAIIQRSQKTTPGTAYIRSNDSVKAGDPTAKVPTRWIVSDCAEYGGNNLMFHSALPFFLDSWKFCGFVRLVPEMHISSHFYDALGRDVKHVNPNGTFSTKTYYPWFVVAEDENDNYGKTSRDENIR